MSHIGIVCPPIPGHLNPFCTLGRALISRGHQITVFHVSDVGPMIRAEGLGFVALGESRFRAGTLKESVAKLAELQGMKSIQFAIECECRISSLILEDGPDAFRMAGLDGVLVDQNEPAGASVAEHLGLPFVSVCTSLPLNREASIPPPFVGWRYDNSAFARIRNRIGYAISDRFIAPIQRTLNQYRRQWNLALLKTPDDSFSRIAEIAQMPREFDFPRERLRPTFHYCGPWFDKESSRVAFPFERLDGRPLIYGSLGTLQRKDSRYFQIMAEACAGLDAQLVLSLGGQAAGTEGGAAAPALAGNPIVVNYAPQLDLLARASVTITHSGMNTTQQSLYFGVPLIAIPLTHDQPAIAARLERTGAGIVIPPGKLDVKGLRGAIRSVLPSDSNYRGSAQRMRGAIAGAGGVERAAEIAEAAIQSHFAA